MAIKPGSPVIEERETNLAQLWAAAVADYEKQTGKSLRLGAFRSMDEAIKETEGLTQKFKDFRNNKSKIAKVRTAFQNNLWLIQRIVNTAQVVGTNISSAFPAAMPANIVFAALGQVMQSFADQSADYDKVMGFFELTHRFLDRLSIIENMSPALPQFERCVTRVFSSILRICAVAQRYVAEKRLKKWFDNMLKGEDADLAAAMKELEEAVNELSQAVGLSTLKLVEVLQEVTQSMDGKLDFLVAKTTALDERTVTIETNTGTIMNQNQILVSKQDEMAEMQRATLEMITEQNRQFNTVIDYFGSIQMGRNLSEDFEGSLLKLDVIRLRLSRWRQSVGLANINDVNSLEEANICPEDLPRVADLLAGILDRFSDAERLSKRFQLRRGSSTAVLDPKMELDGASALLHQKMNDLVARRIDQLQAESRAKLPLPIYEVKTFSRLIEDIGELVNDLIDSFPATHNIQRGLAEQEVSEMKAIKGALPLLKEAAADQDSLLAETVAKAIRATTTSTYNQSVVFSGPNSGFQIGNNSGKISNVRIA
ncbi:uncharacterized protein BO80DRAFT_421466 [Aspergillus ibericus CBS 121593]|uniref:Prion-inhibition and propagation HeLo domain-containing protein n=1 Tax=Aspergillus ibericus CBS 121593 TaxID=1448316 RepID=A0A395HBW3_9EURO|nr:hypothetical protein BO80DRAFT_421466 [Aspergillus ibericus CBS 121593]RAL05431.1 hypothetical protein BO80DRAFT_421466 [Aspergillus ibericus CBS 121593]